MKRYILLMAVMLSAAVSVHAADPLRALTEKLGSSRLSFGYVYSANRNGVLMKGSGTAELQGEAFRMKGDGLEIVSDGTVRWTVDADGRELIIEPVDASATDFISNPARLLANVENAFRTEGSAQEQFQGQTALAYELSPSVSGTGIRRLKLFFSDQTLVGASVEVKDGTVTEFSISGMAFSTPGPTADFRFDEKTAGSGWVVTDLR